MSTEQPSITFSGEDLGMLRDILIGAVTEVGYQIGSCPDVVRFAEDLRDLEELRACYGALLNRVERELGAGK